MAILEFRGPRWILDFKVEVPEGWRERFLVFAIVIRQVLGGPALQNQQPTDTNQKNKTKSDNHCEIEAAFSGAVGFF